MIIGFIIPAEARQSRGTKQIERMDTDKDGKVSRDEWSAYYSEKFTEKDTDGDGFVTSKEMESSRGSRSGKRGDRDDKD